MITYRNWKERLAAASGVASSRVRYTRKSTESGERQVSSHAQQREAIDQERGPIEDTWLWQDSCTGTNFARPSFEDLLEYCRANKRSKKDPGVVEMYDPSRFGRILDEDGAPDLFTFQAVFSEFERHGWQIYFVTVKRSGEALPDMMTMAVYAYAAALYSANLSIGIRSPRGPTGRPGRTDAHAERTRA